MEEPAVDVVLGIQDAPTTIEKKSDVEPPPHSPNIRHSSSRGSLSKAPALTSDKDGDFEPVYLREKFSSELLTRYYRELLIPNIPFEDERDPIEKIERGLKRPSEELRADNVLPYVNLCLLVHRKQSDVDKKKKRIGGVEKEGSEDEGEKRERLEIEQADIVGAVQFEYYCTANCGLITYLLTNEKFRGRGIAKTLVFYAQSKLEVIAKFFGHLAGCNAVFVETNSATKVSASNDVIAPFTRHTIFHKMGMRLLDFDYVQAPLTKDKSKVNYLLLLVFLSPRIPQTDDIEPSFYLPSSLVRNVLSAFWAASPVSYRQDVDYKRMVDQLKRRNRIMLLDLPWDRPFTIVDLRENIDFELMVTFYEMMTEVYGRENLIVLDEWLNAVSSASANPHRGGAALPSNEDMEAHVLLSLQYSEHEREHAKPCVAGGFSFSYFPSVNCGLIQHPVLPREGGSRMAQSLFDWAISEIDLCARQRGHLAGSNAIFMEAVAESIHIEGAEERKRGKVMMSSGELHVLFEQLGWRLVDFDFSPPPQMTELGTVTFKNRLLLVKITSHIPRFTQVSESGIEEFSYLNQSTVLNFVTNYWKISQESSISEYVEEEEVTWKKVFVKMEEQLVRCERIPLRSRPWRRKWMLVDLAEDPDRDLLDLFKKRFIDVVPGLNNSLDFNEWVRLLNFNGDRKHKLKFSNFEDKTVVDNDFHLLLALARPQLSYPVAVKSAPLDSSSSSLILAALVFEYNVRTNCGFISNFLSLAFATREDPHNPEDVGGALLQHAIYILEQNAVARGHLSGCNCIFMELLREESPPLSQLDASVVVDIRGRHKWVCEFGIRLLDVDYVPPPIQTQDEGIATKLKYSLAVLLTPRIPRFPVVMNEVAYYLPQELVQNFLRSYWENTCIRLNLKPEKFLLFRRMMDLVNRRRLIPLLELPWEREWTLVDLYECSDVALLYSFYHSQKLWAEYGPKREMLASWVSMLESREERKLVNLHIILALEYPSSSSGIRPTVVGGAVSKYFSQINCALVTHVLTTGTGKKRHIMGFSLLEELVENIELNAIEGGHIAGCNSIFMEVELSTAMLQNADKKRLSKLGSLTPNRLEMEGTYFEKENEKREEDSPGPVSQDRKTPLLDSLDSALIEGGWWLVDMEYFQPPLTMDITTSELKGARLSLLVLVTQKLPRDSEKRPYLTGDIVRSFVKVYWQHACERVGKNLDFDRDYQAMMSSLGGKRIPLVQIGAPTKKLNQITL